MALPQQLGHRPIRNTALPYDSFGSPIKPIPVYLAGSNVMTSLKTYAERRPGFNPLEVNPTTFPSGGIRRLFTWHQWNGTFYVMLSVVDASGNLGVYKYRPGTDLAFQSVFLGTLGDGVFYDFVVSNNTLFFSSPSTTFESKKWDGTVVRKWGIAPPGVAAVAGVAAGAGALTTVYGYKYVYSYHNGLTGHVSSPSQISGNTGPFTNQNPTVGITASLDPQVTGIRVFRTTDGGGGIFFEILGSPFSNSTQTVTDTTPDNQLSTISAPVPGFNDPPPAGLVGMIWFANRLWGFSGIQGNFIYFSGFEEITIGVPEECWPSGLAGNFIGLDNVVTALEPTTDFLIAFTPTSVHRIEGDGLDTFRRSFLAKHMGARYETNVTSLGKVVAWLNVDKSIWVTDGYSLQEISQPVRNELLLVDLLKTTLVFYNQDIRHWLIVVDGLNSKLLIYDLDTQQWMPPWNSPEFTAANQKGFPATAGETTVGNQQFIIANVQAGLVHAMTPSTYQDRGVGYTAFVRTNLLDMVTGSIEVFTGGYTSGAPGGHIGEPEYVALETDNTIPQSVQLLTDDDPFVATFGEKLVQAKDAPLRRQGTQLRESWYYRRKPAARRASVQINWDNSQTNFRLYSIDLAYNPMQGGGKS